MQDDGAQVVLMIGIGFSFLSVVTSLLVIGVLKRKQRKGRRVQMDVDASGRYSH